MHEMCRKEGVLMPVNVNEIEPDEKIVEIEIPGKARSRCSDS